MAKSPFPTAKRIWWPYFARLVVHPQDIQTVFVLGEKHEPSSWECAGLPDSQDASLYLKQLTTSNTRLVDLLLEEPGGDQKQTVFRDPTGWSGSGGFRAIREAFQECWDCAQAPNTRLHYVDIRRTPSQRLCADAQRALMSLLDTLQDPDGDPEPLIAELRALQPKFSAATDEADYTHMVQQIQQEFRSFDAKVYGPDVARELQKEVAGLRYETTIFDRIVTTLQTLLVVPPSQVEEAQVKAVLYEFSSRTDEYSHLLDTYCLVRLFSRFNQEPTLARSAVFYGGGVHAQNIRSFLLRCGYVDVTDPAGNAWDVGYSWKTDRSQCVELPPWKLIQHYMGDHAPVPLTVAPVAAASGVSAGWLLAAALDLPAQPPKLFQKVGQRGEARGPNGEPLEVLRVAPVARAFARAMANNLLWRGGHPHIQRLWGSEMDVKQGVVYEMYLAGSLELKQWNGGGSSSSSDSLLWICAQWLRVQRWLLLRGLREQTSEWRVLLTADAPPLLQLRPLDVVPFEDGLQQEEQERQSLFRLMHLLLPDLAVLDAAQQKQFLSILESDEDWSAEQIRDRLQEVAKQTQKRSFPFQDKVWDFLADQRAGMPKIERMLGHPLFAKAVKLLQEWWPEPPASLVESKQQHQQKSIKPVVWANPLQHLWATWVHLVGGGEDQKGERSSQQDFTILQLRQLLWAAWHVQQQQPEYERAWIYLALSWYSTTFANALERLERQDRLLTAAAELVAQDSWVMPDPFRWILDEAYYFSGKTDTLADGQLVCYALVCSGASWFLRDQTPAQMRVAIKHIVAFLADDMWRSYRLRAFGGGGRPLSDAELKQWRTILRFLFYPRSTQLAWAQRGIESKLVLPAPVIRASNFVAPWPRVQSWGEGASGQGKHERLATLFGISLAEYEQRPPEGDESGCILS